MIIGTVVNSAAVVAGSIIGLTVGKKLTDRVKENIMKALGLAVVCLGIRMAIGDHDFFAVVVAIVAGTFIGEIIDIDRRLDNMGKALQKHSGSKSSTFVLGFVSAAVLFCVGSMAVIGSINDGMNNDPQVLYVKSVLDGVASIILASTLGIGVIFSVIALFLYQGALSLLAFKLGFLLSDPVYINGISVTGGVIIIGIGVTLTGMVKIKTANMLPALVIIVIYDYILKVIG